MAEETDKSPYSLLGKVQGAEKLLLSGRRSREADLESAVTIFLEILLGFESFDFDQKCVTVFGSARFDEGQDPFVKDPSVQQVADRFPKFLGPFAVLSNPLSLESP